MNALSKGYPIIVLAMLLSFQAYADNQSESIYKAARPDISDNSSISGCCAPCESSSLLRLVSLVRTELNECCTEIERDFQETWTILAEIDIVNSFSVLEEIRATLTTCCAEIDQDFAATWTILLNGFGGTFTALTDIRGTLTECCAEIQRDFNATWTILGNSFGGIFTVLNDVRSTLTQCCAEIQRDFDGVFTVLENLGCGQIQQITAPTTITSPGIYCVANQINGSIVVASSNVVLDLNQQIITGDGITLISVIGPVQNIKIKNGTLLNGAASIGILLNGTGTLYVDTIEISGITIINNNFPGSFTAMNITGGRNLLIKDLLITGGRITSDFVAVTGFGVNDNIEFRNVQVANVSYTSGARIFYIVSIESMRMVNCVITDNTFVAGPLIDLTGVTFESSRDIFVSNMQTSNNLSNQNFIGIEIVLSSDVTIENSSILTNIGVNSARGINIADSNRIIIRNNLVERSLATAGISSAAGIQFSLTADSLIDGNAVRSNQAVGASNGIFDSGGGNTTNTIIRNEVFGHTTNFNITPLPPIITYDISANTVTPVPATVTSYHNLSTVL